VGNSYDYDRDRIGFLERSLDEFGDVFSFSKNTIFVHDPVLVHDLFNRTNTDFIAETSIFVDGQESARLDRGMEAWMNSRKIGFQAMSRTVTHAHGSRLAKDFDAAIEATGGQSFDVMPVMRSLASRTVADFLFGPGAEDVVTAAGLRSSLVLPYMASNFSIPEWLPLPRIRRAVRAEVQTERLIGARIDRRKAHPHAEPRDMLDLLLADPESGLSREDMIRLLSTSMLAAFGSPSAALSWMIVEMTRTPQVHAKLGAEARQVLAEHGGLENDGPLRYTRAFVKEVLRLYPPTWLMGRKARQDTSLGEWMIRRGQEVMFSPYLLHRDPRWWTEPGELRPERWLGTVPADSRRAYVPFGAGSRVCIGLHLSLYQLAIAVARLAALYRIDAESTEHAGRPGAMLVPGSLRARITRIAESAATRDLASGTRS
jgi:unspecific monooxygenase